jgi:hypothetical protein
VAAAVDVSPQDIDAVSVGNGGEGVVDNASTKQPFAEAGLDQTGPVDAVVYLDAFGSRAATGNLSTYEWRIDRPDGTTIAPACPACELTQFQPTRSGEYAVTLTVEDEAGRTATDTMYVTVNARTAPNATLTGPDEMALNDTAQINLSAHVSAGQLQAIEWYADGEYRRGEFLDTDSLDRSLQFAPASVGRHTISAVVRNDNGTARRVRHDVMVEDPISFAVALTDADDSVKAGQYWAPEFEVTNTGSTKDTQEITLSIPGRGVVDRRSLTLSPGETASFDDKDESSDGYPVNRYTTFTPPTLAWYTASPTVGGTAGPDGGTHTATVSSETDSDSTTVDVKAPPYFDVEITDRYTDFNYPGVSRPVGVVESNVTNTGDATGTQTLDLGKRFFGDTSPAFWNVYKQDVTIMPGESKTLSSFFLTPSPNLEEVYVRSNDDTDSVGWSGGCASCGGPDVKFSLALDSQPTEGERVTVASVTASHSGDTYSQSQWINGGGGVEWPYDSGAPASMAAGATLGTAQKSSAGDPDLIGAYKAPSDSGGKNAYI